MVVLFFCFLVAVVAVLVVRFSSQLPRESVVVPKSDETTTGGMLS
jgi:hypothetical protein